MKFKQMNLLARTSTLLLSLLLVGATSALAAAPKLAFERTWGGAALDRASGVAVAPDGSVYLGGYTASFGTGAADSDWDVLLLKYDAAGTLLWQRTWGVDPTSGFRNGSDDDYALDIALGPDGSIHLGGGYSSGGALILKIDPNGNVIWSRNWAHSIPGHAQSIAVAGDGSVYIAGGINGFGAGHDDILVVKLASDGTLLWQQTWGGPINELARDVAVAPDGSVYVAGEANSFFANDAVLLKYAPDGTLIWQRDWHEGTIQDLTGGEGVTVGPDGSVYLTGFSSDTGVGQHVFLVKFTSDGSVVWESTSTGLAETALGVALAPSGNLYVAGTTLDGDTVNVLVVEFLPDGRIRNSVTWGGSGNDTGEAVAIGPDGAVYVGAIAQASPYVIRKVSKKTRTPVSTLVAPNGTITIPAGTSAVATGTLLIPNGSQTYAGDDDAALLKIIF